MDRWNEIRTAHAVLRLGTIRAAAESLGIHRATVVRHIDALEEELGARLFQRHAAGYTPTEAGRDLARVASATEERFDELAARARGRASEVEGEVIVTCIQLLAPLVVPALAALHARHPQALVRFEASDRLFALEYGEAHVALRGGTRPDHPDNVVSSFGTMQSALYAHRAYLERRGPLGESAAGHDFVGDTNPDSTVSRWLSATLPDARVVFASTSPRNRGLAVERGMGIGVLPVWLARSSPDLVQVRPPPPQWDVPFWLVTHVDLHRAAKVQAVLEALRGLGADAQAA